MKLQEKVEQLALTQKVALMMRKRIFRYSESKISKGSNEKLRERLKQAYGGAERSGKQLFLLLQERICMYWCYGGIEQPC